MEKRGIVESHLSLHISNLKKRGYLAKRKTVGSIKRGKDGDRGPKVIITCDEKNEYMTLEYRYVDRRTGEERFFDTDVYLESTKCNYGGERVWFFCGGCSRNVGVLYRNGYGALFCRQCLNLCYEQQNESRRQRSMHRMFASHEREREAEELIKTVKYKYRNGKSTRKYKRYLRLILQDDDVRNRIVMQIRSCKFLAREE